MQTVVQEMNKLGIIVDLSHTSVQVMMTMMMMLIMMIMMIMTDGSARAGHLPGPGDLLSLLGSRNLQRQQKCT